MSGERREYTSKEVFDHIVADKHISMGYHSLHAWLKVPEFMAFVLDRLSRSEPIDDSILPDLIAIYKDLDKEAMLLPRYYIDYGLLRHGVNQIVKVLYPDEYEERKITKRKLRGGLPQSEWRDVRKVTGKPGFIFENVSMPRIAMYEWLKVPEFVSAMLDKVFASEPLTDEAVLPDILAIYKKLESEEETSPRAGLQYNLLRMGANHLIKVLHPDEYSQMRLTRKGAYSFIHDSGSDGR